MMITFIAERIKEATDKSIEQGKAKYRAYFVNTKIYAKYKSGVDTILETDGYGEVID
ncbi:MAG: hypothetical protein KBS66_07455 [Eubacterium sp.]|nr:hypothetical protein [Candidatus Colimonas fimequi]